MEKLVCEETERFWFEDENVDFHFMLRQIFFLVGSLFFSRLIRTKHTIYHHLNNLFVVDTSLKCFTAFLYFQQTFNYFH